MATRTPQQVRDYIGYKGYSYQPEGNFYLPEQASPTFQPGGFFLTDDGNTLFSAEDIARQYNIPISELTAALPLFETAPSYAQSSSRGGGFFSHLIGLVTSPSFGLAASVIAPSIFAAEAAGAAAAAPGATSAANTGAGLLDASLGQAYADLGVGAGAPAAAAAPVAVATPVATSPLATMGGPNILMDFPANMIDASLGQSYNALGVGAGVPAAAGTVGAANALTMADLAAADASAGLLGSSNALTTGAGAGTLAGYGGAGDVLNAATGGVITGADAATGLGAAAAGAATGAGAATNALSGYGGAGDVLDPVTGSVISAADAAAITNAGFNLSDFAKLAKDYGVPLSLLASAFMGSRAATDAANIQAESAREARQLARDIFNEQKALQEPYRAAGITAQNQLLNLLGLSGNTAAAEYGKFARPFGMSDFQADPGYAFRLSEGMKALEASRAAKGGLLSGATGKALQRYGQEMGSQEYGSAFNRFQTERSNRLQPLSGLTTLGQAAASNQGAAAGAFGQTAGNLTTSIGAAQAAGQVGMTNALTGALGQYLNYSANQDLANALRRSSYLP